MISILKMMKNRSNNFLEKKDSLTKESFKISTKLCISKWNSKTLVKLSKESVKNCLNLIIIKKIIDKRKINSIIFIFIFKYKYHVKN